MIISEFSKPCEEITVTLSFAEVIEITRLLEGVGRLNSKHSNLQKQFSALRSIVSADIEAFDVAIKALEEVERYKKVIEEFYARLDYDCGLKGLDDYDYCSGLIHAKRILERQLEE